MPTPGKKRSAPPDSQVSLAKRLKPPDNRLPKAKYRIVQTKLEKILKEPALKPKILEVCINMHKLAILSYQFAALYLTHLLTQQLPLPIIDDSWFIEVIRCVAYATNPTRTQRQKAFRQNDDATDAQKLTKQTKDARILESINGIVDFMNQHFRSVIPTNDLINIANLTNQINYLATEMTTALGNNVREHYDDYLRAFIQYVDPELDKIGSRMSAIMRHEPLDLPLDHPLHQHIPHLIPEDDLAKNYVGYDIKLKGKFNRYIPCMFYMLKILEVPKEDGEHRKMFQLFPLRTNIIPKSVRIDTRCLGLRLRLPNDGLGNQRDPSPPQLWDHYFKTDEKCFGTGNLYRFGYQSIITDGTSCSIQQTLREDHPRFRGVEGKTDASCSYVHDLKKKDRDKYTGMDVVGIDPGVQDLLYCSKQKHDPVGMQPKTKRSELVDIFRYSSKQRAFEMKTKKFNRKRNKAIDDEPLIQGKTVQQWQHELSFETKKTTDYATLLKYVKKKNQVNKALLEFWSRPQFRLMKWQAKINKRRSEDRMVQAFKEKFGPPEATLIAMGDWSRGRGLKFGGPTKGKSFRTLFGRFGYQVLAVHEYRTSVMCHNCHNKTKKGQRKENEILERKLKYSYNCAFDPKCDGCVTRDEQWVKSQNTEAAKKKQEQVEKNKRSIHGLLVCKTCNTFWNRDLNGSLNIGLVAREHLAGRGRPEYLQKEKKRTVAIAKVELDESADGKTAYLGGSS